MSGNEGFFRMKRRNRSRGCRRYAIEIVVLTAGLIGLMGGCSTYTAKEAPAAKPESMPFMQTAGSVVIGVDPYVRAERSEAIFDEDLMAAAMIPLQVVVRNLGERPVPIQ